MAEAREDVESRLSGLYHLLGRFQALQAQRDAVLGRYAHHYRPYKRNWRAGMYWLWVLVLTIAFTIVVMSVIGSALAAGAGTQVTLLMFLPLPAALVASGIIVPVRNAFVPAMNSRREAFNRAAAERIAEVAAPELAPVEAQLAQARQEFQDGYRGWFPERYLNTEDVAGCWRIVHDHRASTVETAINVYETDLHRQRLENMAAAQLAEQQRATRVAALGNIINAVGQGAMIGTLRAEGAATRAAINAPRTFTIKHR